MKTNRILFPLLALVSLVCFDARAALFVTKASQGSGANWTAAIWSNAPSGTGVAPAAGNTYELIDNGVAWGNNTANSRTRNPATDGLQTFPGDSLTLNANTDIRFKRGAAVGAISATICNFPGVGGAPGLILNGGILNPGDDIVFIATGRIHVASQSILSSGDNGGGSQKDLRAMYLRGTLTGPGNLVVVQSGTTAHLVDADGSGYSGTWIIQNGFVQLAGNNSLGRGSVTLSPTNADPATAVTNLAKFEPMYDIVTPGTLTVNSNGAADAIVVLHQNVRFAKVIVDGSPIPNGTYPYAVAAGAFPTHIAPGGSGSISIGPATPTGLTAQPGDTVALLTWNGNADATGYVVKVSTTLGGPYTPVATNGTGTNFVATNLVNGTTYYYVVSELNDGGESVNSNEASVTPAVIAPLITAEPVGATNCTGANVTFSVTATGGFPLAYQWYTNAPGPVPIALANQTNSTLTLNNIQVGNAGEYTVTVTNTGGSVTSAVAILAIKQATVASTPASATNCPGTAVSFSTTASGSGTLTYTWRKGATIIQGPDGTSSYSIASVAAGDAGPYSVTVIGDCNTISNNFTLVVAAVPVITAQPQNQTTPLGNGAVFSVTAISTNATFVPVTYQWQTNNVDVTDATGTSLALSNLTLAASGTQVRVLVTDCAGTTTSSTATLTVTVVSGISFDFDTPGQFVNAPYYLTYNNWINSGFLNGTFAGPPHFEASFGGTGPFPGSGSVDLHRNNNVDNTSILLPVSFDFSLPGKTLYASTMFQVKTPITAGRRATQFGFVSSTNIGIADVTPQAFMSVIVQSPTAATPNFELRAQRRTSGGGLQESVIVPATTLTVSNWYRLNVTFTNTKHLSVSNFAIVASLQDMGPLGTTPGAIAMSFTTTTNTADIVNFKNVYLALRSFEDGGVEQRDNTYAWTTPGNIFFVQEPQSLTVLQGNRANLRSFVDGEGPYTYQWQRDDGIGGFTNIPLAGSWNYITPPARTTDNASQYRVVVTGPANTITSSPATLTVTPQTLAVVGAGSVDGSTVGVEFNQPVNVASAENVLNYTINGANPKQARVYRSTLGPLGPEGIFVVLTPASPVAGAFTVIATAGVQDLSGGPVGGANSAAGTVAGLTGYDVNPAITGPPGENYSFGPGKFIVTGGGSDIFSGGDGFRYVYKQQTGDFDWAFKIPYMNTTRFTAKAGVDARLFLDPFSPGVLASFNPGPMGEAAGNIRQFTEGTAKLTWGAGGTSWGNNIRLFHPDVWMRFRRAGNNFLRYSSTNGVNWVFDGQIQPFTAFDSQPTVYLGLAVCAARNLFAESVQFENFGPFAGYAGAAIAITSQPTNFTVAAGSSFTDGLVATLTGGGAPASAGELAYVWQRTNSAAGGWTNMPTAGQTNNTLSIGPLFFSDNGAQYRVLVQGPGATTVTSATFTATVTDTALPTISSVNPAIPSYQVSEVSINFSEPITAASATTLANYTVTNAAGIQLTVLSASFLNGDPRTVVLKVDGQLGLGTNFVGISGIRDLNNNLLAAAVRAFRAFAPAWGPVAPVVVEYYQDIGTGADITALTANAMFTGGNPSWISYSNVFGANTLNAFTGSTFPGLTFSAGTVAEDNYGVKIYSYFIPPTNGNYKFWIRADDFAQFFMNTNSLDSTNPAGKSLITALTVNSAAYIVGTTPATAMTNITLVAGQAYYMELLFKETGGGDGGSIMWTDPTVNAAPAQTVFIPTANLAYPDAVAPRTPVVAEYYVGYTPPLAANGNLPSLTSGTNLPTGATNFIINDNIEQLPNWKYIAGLPDFVGYQKYFGAQPQLANTRLDNYMGRIISYFVAPSNGNYRFYMRSDDASQFYMNTNAANSTDAAGKKLIGRLDAFTSAYTLVGQNVSLIGGQKYYMEALWREGGGGDGVALAVRSQGDAAVPPIGPPPEMIPASMMAYPFEYGRAGALNFTGILPGIAAEGQSLTLIPYGVTGALIPGAGFGTDSQRNSWGFLWYKNGVRVLDNSFTNITPPLTLADNGAVYKLVMTNMFSTVERSITLTVVADTAAPVITRTLGWRGGDGFTIKFNERVDQATATYLGNYMANNGLQLLSATLDPSGTMLSIRTSPQALATTYTVMVSGVKDVSSAGNTLVTTNVTFTTWGLGGKGVLVELFTNIVGSTIGDLAGAPKFNANLPDVVYYTNTFSVGGFGANTGLENYGARVTALFVPTNTGLYRFYTRQDDAAMLFMNINSVNSEDPNGKTMILHSQGANISLQDPRSISSPIALNAGQRYYMEALMKEGTGGDYMLITFRNTDSNGTALGLVPPPDTAAELMGLSNFGAVPGEIQMQIQLAIASGPPTELFLNENDQVDLKVVAAVVPPSMLPFVSYQWARSNANSGVFTNIPGATASALAPFVPMFASRADDGAAYRLTASLPGTTVTYETLLHVACDTASPTIVSVSSVDGRSIGIRFSEPVELGIAGETGSYDVKDLANNNLLIVLEAIVRTNADPRTVLLKLQTPLAGNSFEVTAYDMTDFASVSCGGPHTATLVAVGDVQGFTSTLDVGGPLAAGSSFSSTNGEISVVAGGADIWGTADQGHLTIGQRSGDFDIWTRVESLVPRSASPDIAKAGLVVRDGTNADAKTLTVLMNPPVSVGGRDLVEAASRTNIVPGLTAPTGPWPSSTNVTPAGIPNAWVRIKREGFIWRAFYSTNGVNWVGFATNFVDFPRTVFVGLGTTAHNNGSAPTVAEYRNIHIPNPPTITVQPSGPATVAFHGSTSFTVTATNPANSGPLTYTWRRAPRFIADVEGGDEATVVVGTGPTLTITDARGVDSGVYQVEVGNDGGSVLSATVSLTVLNGLPTIGSDTINATQNVARVVSAASLIGNDSDPEGSNLLFRTISGIVPVTVGTNFNEGNLAGSTLFGSAAVNTNGYLLLHNPVINLNGSLILDDLTPGQRVNGFRASFKLRISEGTLEPADGFSFNFAPDLPIGATTTLAAENGGGNGFSFCVDNYRFLPFVGVGNPAGSGPSTSPNTSGMKMNFGGIVVAGVQSPTWNRPAFVPVTIELINSAVTVFVDGTNVFGTVVLPSVSSTGRFGLYSRNGGQYQAAMLDDLKITVYTADTTNGGTVAYSGGNVTYSNGVPCGSSDTFYYVVGDGEVGGNVTAPVAVNIPCPEIAPLFVPGSASYSTNGGVATFSASFQTTLGVSYTVEYTDTLNGTPPPWTLLTTIVGDGTIKSFTDPGPLPPFRFYRIRTP